MDLGTLAFGIVLGWLAHSLIGAIITVARQRAKE